MHRLFFVVPLGLLIVLCLLAVALFSSVPQSTIVLPTEARLPSLTPSSTATSTQVVSATAIFTALPAVTRTMSPPSVTSTSSPTLATRVLAISAVMPGVRVAPTASPFPPGTILLPAPPLPLEPLPDATFQPPPYEGWYSFESDHPAVQYSGAVWLPRQVLEASRGQYHRTESTTGVATFVFEGEGLRIRYVAARNMGMFEIVVDGSVIDTIDAYAPEIAFPGTAIYTLARGSHVLQIRSAPIHHAQSEGDVIGLDAIHVFRGSATTIILPPPRETSAPTSVPQPAAGIQLIAAPPTVQPTRTPPAPVLLNVAIVIAYDENGNRSVDPAEGVIGISVRIVEIGTNRVIASGFTDPSGYVQFQIIASSPMRVVVPYFSKFWDLPRGQRGAAARFTLLLTAGNQPGLIP